MSTSVLKPNVNSKKLVIAYLQLFRIFEALLIAGTGALTLIMLQVTDGYILAVFFTIMLVGVTGIFAWNDSLDTLEDSIAHPERPIIRGIISIRSARTIGTILLLISIILTAITFPRLLLPGVGGVAIGIGYSLTSKSRFIVVAPMKNIVVTTTTGIFLALLPWATGNSADYLYYIFMSTLLLLLFGYEILKDIRDVEGDSTAGYRTVPILKGIPFSTGLAATFFALSCLIMGITFLLADFLPEAYISLATTVVVLFPFYFLISQPVPKSSDTTRIGVILVLLVSLTTITVMIYNRFT